MFDNRQFASLLAVQEFYHLVRNLFGLEIAVITPDGTDGVLPGPGRELNAFCAGIQRHPEGRRLCLACDAVHARKATLRRKPIRYTCHAGLTEFIIPILVDEAVVAHLQCGQILDRPPDAAAWRCTRTRLARIGCRNVSALGRAFRRSPVIPKPRQHDLIALLHLFAQHAALAHARRLLLEQDPHDRIVSRAMTFLHGRFRDDIGIDEVAAAAGTSKRTLARVFRERADASVLAHLRRLRVAYACEQLRQTSAKIASVALDSGFGSIQQFNRVFHVITGCSPKAWRWTQSVSHSRQSGHAGVPGPVPFPASRGHMHCAQGTATLPVPTLPLLDVVVQVLPAPVAEESDVELRALAEIGGGFRS